MSRPLTEIARAYRNNPKFRREMMKTGPTGNQPLVIGTSQIGLEIKGHLDHETGVPHRINKDGTFTSIEDVILEKMPPSKFNNLLPNQQESLILRTFYKLPPKEKALLFPGDGPVGVSFTKFFNYGNCLEVSPGFKPDVPGRVAQV